MTREIDIGEIRNVKIQKIKLPDAGKGGVVLLRGRNGCGKSNAVDAVEKMLAGEGSLEASRGSVTGGYIKGLGVSMTVRKATRRDNSCELEVVALEDAADPSVFVDPRMKGAEAADKVRIKALLSLAGVKAGPDVFHELLGGSDRFDKIVPPAQVRLTDPVEIARIIKACCDTEARRLESEADTMSGEVEAVERRWEGVTLTDDDPDALDEAHRKGIIAAEAARSQREAALAHNERVDEVAEKLAATEAPDLETIESKGRTLATASADAGRTADVAQTKASEAEAAYGVAAQRVVDHAEEAKRAKALLAQVEEWRALAPMDAPSGDAIADLWDAAEAAQKAATLARESVKARTELEHAKTKAGLRDNATLNAENLRQAGRATNDILSGLVEQAGVPGLVVRLGRLILLRESDEEFVDKLSDGERGMLIIDAIFTALIRLGEEAKKQGMVALPQHFWDSFNPANKAKINAKAEDLGIVVLAPEATDGDLRAEPFESGSAD